MKRTLVAMGMSLLVVALSGCSAVQSLLGGGGSAVSSLWSDVPPLEGATAAKIDLPLPVKLAMQGFVKASASSSDVKVDNFDFIAFQTPKTLQDVTNFYTKERMAAAGWNLADQPGCAGSSDAGSGGAFCMFGRQGADKKGSLLIVIAAKDDKDPKTNVFFVRFDGIQDTRTK